MNKTIETLTSHRSIRKYKDTPVSEEVIQQIVNAAQWSSTSSHFQAYTIINVKDPIKREAIAQAAGGDTLRAQRHRLRAEYVSRPGRHRGDLSRLLAGCGRPGGIFWRRD